MDFEELLDELDPTGEWETDGYGMDSCLSHCGELIEQDCPQCCVCGAENPIMAAGKSDHGCGADLMETITQETPVRFTTNNLGTTRFPDSVRFTGHNVGSNETGIYYSPHPNLATEDWHLCQVEYQGELLFVSVHRSHFEVIRMTCPICMDIRPTPTTTPRPLTVGQAVDLGSICEMAIHNKRVARLLDGMIVHGTARHFVVNPDDISFPNDGRDIRDCYLRVTTAQGFEAFWKVSDLMDEFRIGYFCLDPN